MAEEPAEYMAHCSALLRNKDLTINGTLVEMNITIDGSKTFHCH